MSAYNPPIEDITEFNTSLFNQPEETLSQAEADRLYLSKTKSDISTAGSTTFNGGVSVGGMLDLTSGANTSEIFQSTSSLFGYNLPLVIANKNPSGHTLFINQNNTGVELPILTLNNTGTTRGVIVNSEVSLFTRTIKSTNTNSGLHTLFDNMIGSGVLTIGGTASTNSIRGNTTFPQNVTIDGTLSLTSGANTSEISQSGNTLTIANKVPSGSIVLTALNQGITLSTTALTMNNFLPLNTRIIRSTDTSSITHSLFDNITTGTLNIGGVGGTNSIRGNTTFPQNVTIGTDGVPNNLSIKGELRCYDIDTPYTTYTKISTTGTSTTYEASNIAGSTHVFKSYTSGGALSGSLFEINTGGTVTRSLAAFTGRLNFSASSYNFATGFSSGNLGYYLKETGGAFSYTTSATPKTILTTSSIPVGVWRIDFSVQLVVGATGAGTITQSQSYLSTTLDGNVGTAVPFTGSILRSHVSEVYANNDIQVITSNITYQQSTAGVLRLNIVRSFATGTYSFIGEVAVTRLA